MGKRGARILEGLLDRRALRRLADERSFERGEDYFAGGQVRSLVVYDGAVTAKVAGTQEYRVKLWAEGGTIASSCTCPYAEDGAFCKHMVATGLAWLSHRKSAGGPPSASRKPAVTMEDVRAYLAKQDKEALVKMLMEQATDDDRLRERLLMSVAKRTPRGIDLGTFRAVIDNAVETDDFVDYRSAYGYATGIEKAVDSVAGLLKEGHAAETIELAEYALKKVERAIGSMDDSDGHMGGIFQRLQDLHLAACKRAKPDPEVLAKRLFQWEISTDWDTFYGAAGTYRSVLGQKGLEVYRRLAETEWKRLPALGPGHRSHDEGSHRRFRITSIMETLAQQTGDVEALVAVKSRDLSDSCNYLQIAEIYQQAQKSDLALEWAERGLKAFPERIDSRLRDFLAREYHRTKRHDEAMALVWANLVDMPGLETFKALKAHADRIDQWPPWRDKALGFLRERAAKAKKNSRYAGWHPAWGPEHSTLVEIFLWERDVEAAWQEARERGCSGAQWLDLAAKREKDHPADALMIYQKRVEPTLDLKNNDAYKTAIGFLRKIGALMARLGTEGEFSGYLVSIRAAHKPKRNFIKLLDAARLG